MSSLYTIYTGQWTDHTQGSVLGNQVTLPPTGSKILIAFIAVFISFVGAVAWMIICYAAHSIQTSHEPVSAFDHQIQAMLRNSSSALAFAKDLALAGISWRQKSRSIFVRALLFSLFAMTVFAVFSIAGICLSLIARTGRVLIVPTNCGQLVPPSTTAGLNHFIRAIESLQVQNFRTSVTYSQNCYGTVANLDNPNSTKQFAPAADCGYYVTPSIPFRSVLGNDCPFSNPDICSVPSDQIIRLETDLVNSNQHLGLNGQVSDQVSFRLRTTCSPIDAKNFSSRGFVPVEGVGDVASYYFGENILREVGQKSTGPNMTFSLTRQAFEARAQPYNLKVVSNLPQNSAFWRAHFTPIDEFLLPDAITTLIFLSTQVYYEDAPSQDPWFKATKVNKDNLYYSDGPGVVVGCSESWQVCNPAANKCLPFNGLTLGKPENIKKLKFNALQEATYWNYLEAYLPSIGDSAFNLDMFALDALDRLSLTEGLLSRPLPNNHWHSEMARFFATSLAFFQRGVITGATNAIESPANHLNVTELNHPYPSGSPMEHICNSQQINNSEYVSFPVLGLGLIFGLGGLIIVIGVILVAGIPIFQRLTGKNELGRKAWQNNSLLQIQRTMFENAGVGEWEDGFKTSAGQVPRTMTIEKFCSPTSTHGSITRLNSDSVSSQRVDSFATTIGATRETK